MMKIGIFFGLCLSVLPAAQAASFDCNKAKTPTEKAICADDGLSRQDEQTAVLYQRQMQSSPEANWKEYLKYEQRNWLKDRAEICGKDVDCLKRDYELRNSYYLAQPILKYTGRYVRGKCPQSGNFMDVTANRDGQLSVDVYICPNSQGNMWLQAEGKPDKQGNLTFMHATCQRTIAFSGGKAVLKSADKKCADSNIEGAYQRDPKRSPYLNEE